MAPEAMEVLYSYPWPGNIRELENLVERLTILKGEGIVGLSDLPIKYQSRGSVQTNPEKIEIPESGMDFNSAVDGFENALILRALEKTGWNRNQAAILLRLNRTTLVEKIKKKARLRQKHRRDFDKAIHGLLAPVSFLEASLILRELKYPAQRQQIFCLSWHVRVVKNQGRGRVQ